MGVSRQRQIDGAIEDLFSEMRSINVSERSESRVYSALERTVDDCRAWLGLDDDEAEDVLEEG